VIGVRCVVGGRVQGVYYRASTAERARSLGLSGWARNLADGNVEVVVAGDQDAVAALTAWLWEGPAGARVASVSVEEYAADVPGGFATY